MHNYCMLKNVFENVCPQETFWKLVLPVASCVYPLAFTLWLLLTILTTWTSIETNTAPLRWVVSNYHYKSSDRRPNLAKGGQLPQESYIIYIPQESCYFRHPFPYCSHAYILFLFNISIAKVGTHKRIAKICVSKSLKLKFLWNFENCQNWF